MILPETLPLITFSRINFPSFQYRARAYCEKVSHPYASTVTLLCVGVPPSQSVELGVDLGSWRTAAAFRGLKFLAPGTHALASSLPGAAPAAWLLHAHAGDVVAAAWDAGGECLAPHDGDGADALASVRGCAGCAAPVRCGAPPPPRRLRRRPSQAVASLQLDAYLGAAAPAASLAAAAHAPGATAPAAWPALTCFLAPAVLARLQPAAGGLQRPPADAGDAPAPAAARGGCFYSRVAGVGSAATPAERTAYGVDTSPALRGVLAACARAAAAAAAAPAQPSCALFSVPGAPPAARSAATCDACRAFAAASAAGGGALTPAALHLCGELQFAFVSFLVGQSYTGFVQWKHLVDALCRCEALLLAAGGGESGGGSGGGSGDSGGAPCADATPAFFAAALGCVAAQLRALPADFFVDELSKRNFLGTALAALVRTATTYARALDAAVLRAVLRLCDAAADAFGGWAPPGADALRAAGEVLALQAAAAAAAGVAASASAGASRAAAAGGSGCSSEGGAHDSGGSDGGGDAATRLRAGAVAAQEGLLLLPPGSAAPRRRQRALATLSEDGDSGGGGGGGGGGDGNGGGGGGGGGAQPAGAAGLSYAAGATASADASAADLAALLETLRAQGGDDDLPAIEFA